MRTTETYRKQRKSSTQADARCEKAWIPPPGLEFT